jgi:glucokinase
MGLFDKDTTFFYFFVPELRKRNKMEKPYVIGIDLGGTNTIFGIVDARGTILQSGSIKTGAYPEIDAYINALSEGLLPIIEKVGGKEFIKGIGVGAPMGNYFSGCIENAVNLPWKGIIPLARLLSDKTGGIPVTVTNDANAAAMGEMAYGAARGMKDFIVIALGTGVGSGIVIGGRLVYGHDGFAGELGHVIMRRENGRMCGCGRPGCLEAYTSATGVARTAKELLMTRTDASLLRNLEPETISSKDVYEAAIKGDKLSIEIFELTGEILGEAFADFIAFSTPEAIILFGGLTKAGDLLMNPIQRSLDKHVLTGFAGKTKLLFSQLKESDAAILGASALGWETSNA